MFNKKFLPIAIKLIFPRKRSFKNEAHRAKEATELSKLVSRLDYRVAVLN